jgi:hypothetical protein
MRTAKYAFSDHKGNEILTQLQIPQIKYIEYKINWKEHGKI